MPVEVSVVCLTYNHEQYIRKCLEGFVMQKTNFEFEVIVHDDASTDGTTNIIKEFEAKYPKIIKPIYQKENQYSKGVPISKTFIYPRLKGKYVATCEGDDYWTDPNKLQLQYDFMESHQDFLICFHNGIQNYLNTGEKAITPNIKKSKEFQTDEIIKAPDGLFVTCSMFRRRETIGVVPDCFKVKGVSDIQIFVHTSTLGKCYCFSDVMSVYNCGTKGSWSEKNSESSKKKIEHLKTMNNLWKTMDDYYKGKYHDSLSYKILYNNFQILLIEKNFQIAKKAPYKKMWRRHLFGQIKRKIAEIPFVSYLRKHRIHG